ncbi:DNA protecting protein DprA [Quadrisphaera granulorum]|uniref:DNA protecting protein DprA n=2 Tax=Quadrisphaera granulorum TaxID=317664 RepID=A0A316AF41_9ACTN|nr:DNA protecting protein DprA [Quadrisphaera granulorum]SZE95040.1 DNA protecting protein DprA [Quadrisphaera granulorum]
MTGWQQVLPLGAGASLPRWVADARLAQLAWSRLAEPEDLEARRFVGHRGPSAALERLASPAPVSAAECFEGESVERLRRGLARWASRWDQTDPERDLDRLHALGGRVVLPGDAEWPDGLALLDGDEPFALWVRGPLDLAAACERSIAVVGARAATAYGERIASQLGIGLGDAGATTISGAALGIDGAAHRGALASGGPTVAVLACGVDRAYPPSHAALLRALCEEGLVVSELPPGSSPMKRRFLQRNRLIAAAAGATVVVEAGWRSGALSTANRAQMIGKPIGAVPGPITSPSSEGCHRLLRREAVCITDASEALQLLKITRADPERPVPARPHDGLSDLAGRVLDAVPLLDPRSAQSIVGAAGLPLEEVRAGLEDLVMHGLVVPEGGGWRRAPLEEPPTGRGQ